jgi:hypothetical protein
MTSAQGQELQTSAIGGTCLLGAGELGAELGRAEPRGLLPVSFAPPGPAGRGRLALTLEAAIEDALAQRGACAPGVGPAASLDESLSDQLYRSRLIELRGMVLAVPSLEGIVGYSGALDPEDSAVLRWWFAAAHERPVRLLVDRTNASLLVYGPPRALYSWIGRTASRRDEAEAVPALAPEVVSSAAAMELSEPPPAVVEQDGALSFQAPLDESEPVQPRPPVASVEPVDDPERPSSIGDLAEAVLETLSAATPAIAEAGERRSTSSDPATTAPEAAAPVPAPTAAERPVAGEPADALDTAAVMLEVPPLYPRAREEWPGWARELETTRGPRPLAVIERTFVTSYVPLLVAAREGLTDVSAERALEVWARNFSQSYREAFDALRVRGKRPAMVLDAPDIALRTARLHGARTVQLLLIDGLRFDLGLCVEQRVRALTGQRAALAERLLLWSALPSTTDVQLELIGRGASGLSEPLGEASSEVPVARGRQAATPRRVRAGHRDLFKLDLVEARLAEPGPREPERLNALAAEVATSVVEFLSKQPPRTLVLAFGDHGFVLDPRENGTGPARKGGSSPEEVLVPAFAWLVGGLH